MSSENNGTAFTFDYISVINLAREFDSFKGLPSNHLAVGLVGSSIYSFARRLKQELVGDEDVAQQLALALARVGQLEEENASLKAKLVLTTTAALSAMSTAALA